MGLSNMKSTEGGGGTTKPRPESQTQYDERRRQFQNRAVTEAAPQTLLSGDGGAPAQPSKRLLGE